MTCGCASGATSEGLMSDVRLTSSSRAHEHLLLGPSHPRRFPHATSELAHQKIPRQSFDTQMLRFSGWQPNDLWSVHGRSAELRRWDSEHWLALSWSQAPSA
eukprot:6411884-Prymnesium_polylepis.1